MMKNKRTAVQFFNDAEIYKLKLLMKTDLNSDKVFKNLKSDSEMNYIYMFIL